MSGLVSRTTDAAAASMVNQSVPAVYRPALEAVIKDVLTAIGSDPALTAGQWQTDLTNEVSAASGDAQP